jgi:WD40 repeat protein
MCQIGSDYLASICTDSDIRIFGLLSSREINTPVNVFAQEKSGPTVICPLGQTSFLTSGVDRGVRLWDMRQNTPLMLFESIHYDKITSLEKLSSSVFASASLDGNLNVRQCILS